MSDIKKKLARVLRNWAYRLDPQGKPGRKRKKADVAVDANGA